MRLTLRRTSGSLLSATFVGLLLTQFLGATNDNILRWLVIGIGKEYVCSGSDQLVLAIGSGVLRVALYLAGRTGRLLGRSLQQAEA